MPRRSTGMPVRDMDPPARHPLTNAASFTPTPSSAPAREGVLVVEFTDDEEDSDQQYNHNQIQSIAGNIGEDIVRTGETSRLRRRGAVHGRRPQLPYVTLVCGAPLPWQFKFNYPDNPGLSSLGSLLRRCDSLRRSSPSSPPQDLSLEFPSTGCRTVLTNRAYASPAHHVYSAQIATGSVLRVDRSHLAMEQKSILVEVLMNSWGQLDWQGLACATCGNVVGFRYAPVVFDEQGKLVHNNDGPADYTPKQRLAFFPSAVTSSKPYDFTTQHHYSYPYHWRYLEPLSTRTSPILSPGPETSLQSGSRTQNHFNRTDSGYQGSRPYRYNEAGLQSQREDPRFLSSSRPLSPSSLEEYNAEQPSNGNFWNTWPSDHTVAPYENNVIDDFTSFGASMTQRSMEPQNYGQPSPWQAGLILEPQSPDRVYVFHPRNADLVGTNVPMESIDTSLDTSQGQHASDVPSDEHEPLGLGMTTANAVTEVEAPFDDDHYAEFVRVFAAGLSAREHSRRPLGDELPGAITDSSQVHYGPERVHDNMIQSESGVQSMLRQEPRSQFDAAVQANTANESLPVIPSATLLSSPLPIAYESPATIVDVETSNETTGEVENIAVLIEVASPPPDMISDFGSAVVASSLPWSTTGPVSPQIGLDSSASTSMAQPTQPGSSLEPSPLNSSHSNVDSLETQNNSLDVLGASHDLNATVVAVEESDEDDEERFSSLPFRHYTPPLQPLSSRDPSPSPPISPLTLTPPFHTTPLFTSHQLIESEMISADTDVSSEHYNMATENVDFLQLLDCHVETSVQSNGDAPDVSQPYIEQALSTDMGSDHSVEAHVGNDPVLPLDSDPSSSLSSPPLPISSSSPRPTAITTPVSHLRRLHSPPIVHEDPTAAGSSAFGRFPRHTITTPSSSERRSSSRRSWRTPRESSTPSDGADIDSSLPRLRSPSRSGVMGLMLQDESRSARDAQLSPSASRRIRGHSRSRRRRLSSSSRRGSHLSSGSMSASGPAFRTPPSDLIRLSGRLQMLSSTLGSQNQARPGDSSHLQSRLTANPELIRRGSMPNIQRPRLGGLLRRDSLPVLPMQRQPLSDLVATLRRQVTAIPSTDSPLRAQLNPTTTHDRRDHNSAGNSVSRRHWGERVILNTSRSRGSEQDAGVPRHARENGLVSSEQENQRLDDPDDVLTPGPRRHTTMPVFIPSPPSGDSDSELEDSVQLDDGVSLSRAPTFPWMPWESCWQDRGQVLLETELQTAAHETQLEVTEESEDKEE